MELDECRHERGHITDSRYYGNRYSTPASRAIFCDICRHQRWLDVEAALALSEAELGMIPADVAQQIAASAKIGLLDLDEVAAEIERSGHSLVGLLRVFEKACGPDAGQYIHYGATTQDIQDMGQTLEMRDVLDAVEDQLHGLIGGLSSLAEANSTTVALGRTHAQPALPMAFGLKLASWLDELLRHAERLTQARERVLAVQLFGGSGTMAAFGDQGLALLEKLGARLGLSVPDIGWHVARDRMVEFVSTLALITGTLGRMADEIRLLSRPEFGEVTELWRPGAVGSSTMPHKRNPERCEQIVVMARLTAAQVGLALTAMIGDHERDSRSLRIEWACVPDVSHYCLAALGMMAESVSRLEVNHDRLRANVDEVADQIMSERLMLTLGKQLGKQHAHEVVYDLTQQAREEHVTVRTMLNRSSEITDVLTPEAIDTVFDPETYLGASEALTMRVVAHAHHTEEDAHRTHAGKACEVLVDEVAVEDASVEASVPEQAVLAADLPDPADHDVDHGPEHGPDHGAGHDVGHDVGHGGVKVRHGRRRPHLAAAAHR